MVAYACFPWRKLDQIGGTLIEQTLELRLPKPWVQGIYRRERIGTINFLVGPNGSGKSRFAESLKAVPPNARLLGTDRLQGTGVDAGFGFLGDNFAGGYQKNWFDNFKRAGLTFGLGVDTFILLEERPDLRVKVEATLTSLFNRRITIEWDSGNLIPKATSGATGEAYRLDREECHGIRELLVLLTHLYNDAHGYLIIDEPELNLHPQYQAFFMQEVRKIAGQPNPGTAKKVVFLSLRIHPSLSISDPQTISRRSFPSHRIMVLQCRLKVAAFAQPFDEDLFDH